MARENYKQKESTLNKSVVKWLNSLEACFAYKRAANAKNRGQADVSGCIRGIRIELEGKIGDNEPTKLQDLWLKRWKAAGAIAGAYWSLDEARQIVSEMAKQHGIEI